MIKSVCEICKSNLFKKIKYKNALKHDLFSKREIHNCLNCGFGKIFPKVSDSDLNYYYENIYRSKNSPMYIDFDNLILNKQIVDYRSLSQFHLGHQFLNRKNNYNFLDIGPGYGTSFLTAVQYFNKIKLHAIENNAKAINFYKRTFKDIKIFKNLEDIDYSIDIILMSHSLEHFDIKELTSLFKKLYDVLSKDGILIIEIPHENHLDKLYKPTNHTPHLSFFTIESLKKLILKTKFELCFINTLGPNISIEKETKKQEKNKIIKIKSYFNSIIKKIIIILGLYDMITKLYFLLSSKKTIFKDENFKYGGNRSLIRLILKRNN